MAKEFAKKFYKSKEWQRCRESYIQSVNGLCETCLNKNIIKPGYIVHHTNKLTVSNINNPDATLNHSSLRYDCLECHNTDELGEHGGTVKVQSYIFDTNGNIIHIPPHKKQGYSY